MPVVHEHAGGFRWLATAAPRKLGRAVNPDARFAVALAPVMSCSVADTQHAALFRRLVAQDRAALGELYDQAGGLLYAYAVRILGDHRDAEEVIQDVFVQIWDKAMVFDPAVGTPLHWMLGITRNRCIDRLRFRQRRRHLSELSLDELPVDQFPEPTPVDAAGLSGPELVVVRSAVASLPGDQRRALELAFFSGLSHHEIAETLSEPLGTVKARIRRGLLKLRESLRNYL
jgi:RNA polymerase sigma-70 factor (ECF subfamily)